MSSIRLKKNIVERKIKSLIKMGILAAVLVLLCVAVCMSGDRTAPVFDFTNAASVYYVSADEEITTDTFLSGVTASDNTDGDLTDRIVVKSMRQNADSSVTVTYSVRDNSGNLTTQERIYNLSGTSTVISISDDDEETETEDTTETQTDTEAVTEDTVSEEISETQPEESAEAAEPVETAETEAPAETVETVADTVAVVVETEEVVVAETSTSEPPVIALTTTEARIATGTVLPYNDYIAYMSDDVDTYEYLQNYIWIEGYYDVDWNVPGVYTLVFRVTDSDGNISAPQTLTVYVGQD